MNLVQRVLNIGISGDHSSLEKLARQIFNFDNLMGVLLPLSIIVLYSINGLITPVSLACHLLIISYFLSNFYWLSKGHYRLTVFVTIGMVYIIMTLVVFSYLNLFNALFFIPLSLNALIYFPEKKKLSVSLFCFFLFSAALFFVIEVNHYSLTEITPFQMLNMKAAVFLFCYLFSYKVLSLLLIYWRTSSRKHDLEKGMQNFLEYTTEGIYLIGFPKPISLQLPLEEQLRLICETAYLETCNDAFAHLYGFQKAKEMEGLVNKRFREGMQSPAFTNGFKRFVEANYCLIDLESNELRKNREEVYFLNNVIGIVEEGCLKAIWGAQRDITALKQSEESIAMRDEVIEKMLSNFPVVYYRFDKNLNFQLSVGAGLKRIGLQNNQVVGQNILELYKDYPTIIENHKMVREEKISAFVSTVNTAEGEVFFDTRITFDKEKQEGMGLALETTERKIAENALFESENRYKNLFQNSFDAILVFNRQKGCFDDFNEGARKIFGLGQDYPNKALTPYDIVPEFQPNGQRSSDLILEHLKALSTGKTLEFEFFHKKANGEIFETETTLTPNSYNPDEILALIKDVSERKEAERALRLRERQLKEAQEVALLGSWEYDFPTESLTWSEHLYHMFKMMPGTKVTYETCLLTLLPPESQNILRDIKNIKENVSFNFSYKNDLKGTGQRWYQMRGKKVFDEEGQPLRISGIIQDITSKKNQEEIIRKALKALNEKNEDLKKYIESNMQLENFAYMASHDLKAPIRTIVSFTQLLKRSFGDRLNENEQEYLHYISSGANSMNNLIEDLLTYSRVNTQNHRLETVPLFTVIDQVKGDLKTVIEQSRARINIFDLPNSIQADVTMMRQLFQNLLSNAIKFKKDHIAPEIEVCCKDMEDYWHFSVKDNGIGINPEFRERIFLLFRKLHSNSKYEGTGIGLALCKKIVEQHGGKIWIDDKYKEGTCFHFTLRKQLVMELV